jgi:hypothetical protein
MKSPVCIEPAFDGFESAVSVQYPVCVQCGGPSHKSADGSPAAVCGYCERHTGLKNSGVKSSVRLGRGGLFCQLCGFAFTFCLICKTLIRRFDPDPHLQPSKPLNPTENRDFALGSDFGCAHCADLSRVDYKIN